MLKEFQSKENKICFSFIYEPENQAIRKDLS